MFLYVIRSCKWLLDTFALELPTALNRLHKISRQIMGMTLINPPLPVVVKTTSNNHQTAAERQEFAGACLLPSDGINIFGSGTLAY